MNSTAMRALRAIVLLGCLVVIVAVPAAYAQEDTSAPVNEAENASSVPIAEAENGQQLWFVELESPPAVEGTNLSTLKQEKDALREEASKANITFEERYAFDKLFNGLSVEVEESQAGALGRLNGVKNVYPVATVQLPEITQEDPDLATALAMTGADVAQSELGYTGKGVKVAVIDTGIDYDHPDLGGNFGVDKRVTTGYDFVGDAFNADPANPNYNLTRVPDSDPDDCQGHGTHVAGIVGANGTVTGVAPGVTFGAYRVFGCEGSTTADVMIEAMERVLDDDMDVLNMSIGADFQWPQYPTAQAADRLVNKGVSVVASIGNSGANGAYAAGAPGVGDKVIGVASFDNSHVNLTKFTISPDNRGIGYGLATAAPAPPLSGSMPMARTGTNTSTDDACSPLPAGSLTGKAALIRRGGQDCTFYKKALNAQNAGAAAVVLYNNVAGSFSATVAGTPDITIPVVTVSDSNGVLINNRLASGSVTMTWTDETSTSVNPTGGRISSSSSYGLNAELGLKPDIGAPGGLIRSTYPTELGSYATISGTSMSSPHVAGSVALLLEAKPNTSSQAVRGILQNSADPKPWWGNPGLGFLDNVHRQGAGMLDIDGAIKATTEVEGVNQAITKIEPGKLSLGESEVGSATKTLTIENNGSDEVTYGLSHAPALSTSGSTFPPISFTTGFASATFSSSSVTVPAGEEATVDVTITANPSLPDKSQYGGYIVVTPQDSEEPYRVPYAGFKGDYQSIEVLKLTGSGNPRLAKLIGNSLVNRPNGATYTLAKGDVPYVLVHLDHQARRLRMEVTDTESGKSWHRAWDQEYLSRNSTATGFFALPWNGKTRNGNKVWEVPDGKYTITLSVQKALGDDANPDHWETWTSPAFVIDRP